LTHHSPKFKNGITSSFQDHGGMIPLPLDHERISSSWMDIFGISKAKCHEHLPMEKLVFAITNIYLHQYVKSFKAPCMIWLALLISAILQNPDIQSCSHASIENL